MKEKGEVLVMVGNFYYIIYDTISFSFPQQTYQESTRKQLVRGRQR